jgi:cell envelope opacity-associated protein A
VHTDNLESSKNPPRIKVLVMRVAACCAVAAAALIMRNILPSPESDAASPVTRAPAEVGIAAVPAASAPPVANIPPSIAPQQASVASIVEVIVGRNDTLDGIFRRMALNKSDLAAIRNLPGIRQSLDFLKPGDAIKLTHTDGDIQGLTRKVSETQTLEVVRQDAGFAAKMINNPVETRVRTATATIDS